MDYVSSVNLTPTGTNSSPTYTFNFTLPQIGLLTNTTESFQMVGTYTSVFIASPILIYLGVGTGRKEAVDSPEQVSANIRFSARDA